MLDEDFPLSEPRVIAPQSVAQSAPPWPHVENFGLLCLSTTRFSDPAGLRALSVLQDAFDVLNLDEASRSSEFQREFVSYWSQRVANATNEGLALLRADPTNRDIYFHLGRRGAVVFADTEDELERWLSNNGVKYEKPFHKTRLVWPSHFVGPSSYPKKGHDLIDLVGQEHLEGMFPLGGKLPIVLGMMIGHVAVFAGALLVGPSRSFVTRGFRPSRPRPQAHLAQLFRMQDIVAMNIERIDAAWVHGRDSNPFLHRMQATSVAIIGCGALGGYLARGLTQAGIGSLHLVDHDTLKAANIGRHVLGAVWIGGAKAKVLSEQLARDFPHANRARPLATSFQALTPVQLAELAASDILVLAGVDLAAELAVDRWIATLRSPPTRVWTWTEEFAHAGHAVALLGNDPIRDGIDVEGRFISRATKNWDTRTTTLGEAGCGTSFQPYAAADMSYTALTSQRLITDIALGKVAASERRTWFGDRDAVIALGAEVSDEFVHSFTERTFPWPQP